MDVSGGGTPEATAMDLKEALCGLAELGTSDLVLQMGIIEGAKHTAAADAAGACISGGL